MSTSRRQLNSTAIYAGAVVAGAPHPDAAKLWLDFIRSPEATEDFRELRLQDLIKGKAATDASPKGRTGKDRSFRSMSSIAEHRSAQSDRARPRIGSKPARPISSGVGSGRAELGRVRGRQGSARRHHRAFARRPARGRALSGRRCGAQNAYWSPMPFAWDYGVLFLVGTGRRARSLLARRLALFASNSCRVSGASGSARPVVKRCLVTAFGGGAC